MLQKLIHFITYHNAVPIIFGVIFLGAGAAFAASPDARDAVLSSQTIVRSVDNSFIVSANIDTFDPELRVVSVEEDNTSYYVTYTYNTIAVKDYVWKNDTVKEVLTVSKVALGRRDLGRYVAEQLGQVVDAKLSYFREAQTVERNKGVTQKIATTEYSGLVGKLLSPKEEIFEGYVPVISEEKPPVAAGVSPPHVAEVPPQEEAVATTPPAPSREEIRQIVEEAVRELLAESDTQTASTVTSSSDTAPPVITVNGNNPAEISVGSSYVDLGAVVTDNVSDNLGIHFKVNGADVTNVNVDTSSDGTHIITYSATDQAGNTGTAERTVIVGTGITSTASTTPVSDESATTTETTLDSENASPESSTPSSTEETATTTESQ
ncbi:DUF5011 domain-containing protein [Candidatus Kaiserbacteria bacterium]|nr:DUF5011 domain-containing protein [Candidatus Kaiserbacteria bacterium]